jgi:hypothetical protein
VIGGAGNTIGYTELQAVAPAIDASLTVSDADNTTLASATVSIASGFLAGDSLNFTNQSGITGSYNAGTGVLTLSGSASVAAYQTALESVTFSSSSHNPTNSGADTSRSISWVVNDGTVNSLAQSTTINITPVNDAPVLNAHGGTLSYTENQAAAAIDTLLTASDVDSTNLTGATRRAYWERRLRRQQRPRLRKAAKLARPFTIRGRGCGWTWTKWSWTLPTTRAFMRRFCDK